MTVSNTLANLSFSKLYADNTCFALSTLLVMSWPLISENSIACFDASSSALPWNPNCVFTSPIASPTFGNSTAMLLPIFL